MASWQDVARIASTLHAARAEVAHEGSPTFVVGRHPFARLRWDEGGREILQFWTRDLHTEAALAQRRDTFFAITTFTVSVSVWAWLDRLDIEELREILTDSWLARRGVRPGSAGRGGA